MEKHAVGYIRGRVIGAKQTRDWRLQEWALRRYAETHFYNYIKTFGEVQSDENGINVSMRQLKEAMQLCEDIGADLFYVHLGRCRRNPIFFRLIRMVRKSESGFSVIRIHDRNILEEVQRLAKYDKHHRPDGTRIRHRSSQAKKPIQRSVDPCLEWKERSGISTKRYRNFCHLISGPLSICEVIHSAQSRSDEQVAAVLNREFYLTVDGKPWRKENVRRTRKIMQSMEFKQFCDEERKKLANWV